MMHIGVDIGDARVDEILREDRQRQTCVTTYSPTARRFLFDLEAKTKEIDQPP